MSAPKKRRIALKPYTSVILLTYIATALRDREISRLRPANDTFDCNLVDRQ